MLAALPTIKFPDQKSVVRINNKYAKLFFFDTKIMKILLNYMVLNLN